MANKTIFDEYYTVEEAWQTTLALQEGLTIAPHGSRVRGHYANPLICYVLFAADVINQAPDGYYEPKEDTIDKARKAAAKLFNRTGRIKASTIVKMFS